MSSRRRRRSSLLPHVTFKEKLSLFEHKLMSNSDGAEDADLKDINSQVTAKIDWFEHLAQLLDPKYK